MRKLALVGMCVCIVAYSSAQSSKWISEGWLLFKQVRFKPKYFKEADETFLVPEFTSSIKSKEGTDVSLSGYYMPMKLDGNRVILSRYPSSSCYFCGGAGPESIAEVVFTDTKPKFRVDQVVTVRGKLRLNDSDIDHVNFILYDAVILEN